MLGNAFSPSHLLVLAVVILVLFGRGRIASLMDEAGKGFAAFRSGVENTRRESENRAALAARDVTPAEERI